MGASIATRMASLAAGARTGLCRHVYDSSASLLWIRRLVALPFCFADFSSSRFIASRGERVGGCPARLRGAERDLTGPFGARAVPAFALRPDARSGVPRGGESSRCHIKPVLSALFAD